MTHPFSPEDVRVLREHGIALFADRVLIAVQPPLSDARIAEIESACAGPLPQALRDLWRLTAGGELAYDLHARMNGNEEALSWAELFYDGSDHYRDLQGWIEHEQECAETAATEDGETWNGTLRYLPIGGFEYCDRIYVAVEPGPRAGSIVAWKQGLPGWTHALQQDGIATIAPDLHAAFAALCLETDPEDDLDSPGVRVLEYLEERVSDHGMPQALADALVAFYRRALVDWRGPLAAGTLMQSPRLAGLALQHAISKDDAALVRQLAEQGMRFDEPLRGSATPVDVALMQHACAAAHALLQAGAAASPAAIHRFDRKPPAELVERLLAQGAQADALGVARCVACGAPEAARRVAAACGDGIAAAYAEVRDAMANSYQEDLRKVRAGKLGHYLGADGLAERVANLREFLL
ncbi:SMI1/KNR4 family protein [Achromobacter spanius]|uniref:SMI1/KNR4 family protein n=1 Tax=Achromobacter spanius TaxID=217203 RepID=A0AA42S7K8_9BURK|nr:SMI1/KNR4 family protein [Achromobacter spanius]MDH0739613.1 SMI1/KNR4 family protein [Achromobacter spanius]